MYIDTNHINQILNNANLKVRLSQMYLEENLWPHYQTDKNFFIKCGKNDNLSFLKLKLFVKLNY